MSNSKVVNIRASILGADRAFKDGGGGGGGAHEREDDDGCPVTALGHLAGTCWFLDFFGQPRALSARDLASRAQLMTLFGGDETWPRKHFPRKKELQDELGDTKTVVVDFVVNALATELIRRASRKGLWGKSITLRQPGVWRGDDGLPIVHCGDMVLIGSQWQKPGFRTGKQIWAAAEAIARPSTPCGPEIALQLQQELQGAWNFKNPEGAIAILGILYSGWLCGALAWRLNAFIAGPTGSGKTALMNTVRACWPEHGYSNDTTKAGMEQTVSGRAIPCVIDEAADRNSSAGRDLVDITLSSSGGEGTKAARGTVDGKGRTAEVVSSVIMFSIYPPPLQPQHVGRFLQVELEKPQEGADNNALHAQITEFARKHSSALWGRAIAAFERYIESLSLFRAALADANCSPREMDSKGALLAGWFVMTNDGLPTDRDLREGVAALGALLVTSAQADADDAPQRALQHLMASQIQLHRSSDLKPIAELLELAFNTSVVEDAEMAHWAAADQLARNGIRPVWSCEYAGRQRPRSPCECSACLTRTKKRVPRPGDHAGVWIATRHPTLDRLFRGTDFDDRKWLTALARARDAAPSGRLIRIGAVVGNAIWLPKELVLPPDDPPH